MKSIDFKYFGIASGVIVSVVLMFVTLLFRINIVFINAVGKIPISFWLILVLAFLMFSAFNKVIKRTTLHFAYVFTAITSFVYFNSMFQWSIVCCPDEYESMYDWNASKGLAWTVSVPVSFLILIIQGLIYDFIGKPKDVEYETAVQLPKPSAPNNGLTNNPVKE